MSTENDCEKDETKALSQDAVICCNSLPKYLKHFGWFSFEIQGKVHYCMPHIDGTHFRINFCPSCGKSIREINITRDDLL